MNNQPTQMAQIQQQNERLQHEAMQLKARIFDAENALGNLQRNVQGLSQEAQLLASILNEEAPLELRQRLVQVAPSFRDLLVTTAPELKSAAAAAAPEVLPVPEAE